MARCAIGWAISAACGLTTPSAEAQAPPYRIGWLGAGGSLSSAGRAESDFLDGLKDLGYVEGRSVLVEYRYANGDRNRLAQLAQDLAAAKVNVIVAAGDSAALAAKRATTTVPVIVLEVATDPVKAGLVKSLARPEANVTGVVTQSEELWEKRLSVFKRIAPAVARAVVLWNPANPANDACVAELRTAGPAQGIQVQFQPVQEGGSIDVALGAVAREKPDALFACWDGATLSRAAQIADFAVRQRMPTLAPFREYVEAGMLMSLGTDLPAHRRRGAFYVDKTLKGAKPGALPVERPLQFDFVINLKTAKAIGVAPQPELLIQAQEVIQ
jgi:putative ABC transport system substrate-binding protein